MNPSYYVIFIVLFIIISQQNRHKKAAVIQQVIKNKRAKGAKKMHELLEKYIGQECVVYTLNNQITGTVTALQDGWLSLSDKLGNTEVLNLDYIIRVRQVPLNKNGKKKAIY